MAKGFITLENGEDFYTRWTGYDMILQIVIIELANIHGGEELAKWLQTRIPSENEEKGDAVFFNKKEEMIQRILDLRGLTKRNRSLFWAAVKLGKSKLVRMGQNYSNLNPDRITELISMHDKINHDFTIEKEIDVALIVDGDKIEKIGPGWKKNDANKT